MPDSSHPIRIVVISLTSLFVLTGPARADDTARVFARGGDLVIENRAVSFRFDSTNGSLKSVRHNGGGRLMTVDQDAVALTKVRLGEGDNLDAGTAVVSALSNQRVAYRITSCAGKTGVEFSWSNLHDNKGNPTGIAVYQTCDLDSGAEFLRIRTRIANGGSFSLTGLFLGLDSIVLGGDSSRDVLSIPDGTLISDPQKRSARRIMSSMTCRWLTWEDVSPAVKSSDVISADSAACGLLKGPNNIHDISKGEVRHKFLEIPGRVDKTIKAIDVYPGNTLVVILGQATHWGTYKQLRIYRECRKQLGADGYLESEGASDVIARHFILWETGGKGKLELVRYAHPDRLMTIFASDNDDEFRAYVYGCPFLRYIDKFDESFVPTARTFVARRAEMRKERVPGYPNGFRNDDGLTVTGGDILAKVYADGTGATVTYYSKTEGRYVFEVDGRALGFAGLRTPKRTLDLHGNEIGYLVFKPAAR